MKTCRCVGLEGAVILILSGKFADSKHNVIVKLNWQIENPQTNLIVWDIFKIENPPDEGQTNLAYGQKETPETYLHGHFYSFLVLDHDD